jgi:hypothetical protein
VGHPRFHVFHFKKLPHFYSLSQLKSSKQPYEWAGLPAKINQNIQQSHQHVNTYGQRSALWPVQ